MRALLALSLSVLVAGLPCGRAVADEQELNAAIGGYVKAFNDQDLDSVAAMWTEDATHIDRETGDRTEGRDAIRSDLAAVFEERPETRLSGQVDSVRMITPEVAKVEGRTIVGVPGEAPVESSFSAIAVKQDGKWMIDSIEEMPLPQPPTSYDALKQLDWLVGQWVDDSDQTRVDTTVRWSPNQAFLIRSFVASDDQGVSQQGTQVIGWDPRSQEIRSWTFNSDGSFGDGVWSQSGEDWLIKSSQTTAEGLAASGTYVLSRPDDETIQLQLIGHEIEGEPQPSTEVVTVVRQTPPADDGSADADASDTDTTPGSAIESGGVIR
ncbi:SgcJ/EcaC family oxidoreductase [Roseiconus nitratireducens]|uniref:SgcJ/EcaC family oxidoreductase n=1 Tax=Roseiconus nitratireducens TaxID=2605748 RepID=A0A5M6CUZ6_9BACT|nr:SgcJ/EcaC family oxidoreductase [Roseiconus nitratireducens]KAA5539067.1 SgcJ/EcaC family oxidoreductase [Roseiconus nitratireducens]